MTTLPVLLIATDTRTLKQHLIMLAERLAAGGKLHKPQVKKKAANIHHL